MSTDSHGTRRTDGVVLVAFLDGIRVGEVHRSKAGALRFVYDDAWRTLDRAYALSLSMPLSAREHGDDAITSFLWGLLPDNERTLERYGKLFGVSPRSPVALLAHMGIDCAGAVQFTTPESAALVEGISSANGAIEPLSDEDIEVELRTVRQQGVPGTTAHAAGQFSLAGAQPKIALFEENGAWGRPGGRIPTNRILKPPSGDFRGFAENEHFCLELAGELELGSVRSSVRKFGGETAIIVERFDRGREGTRHVRIHQEDLCQAMGVPPHRKYQSEGGPGMSEIVMLLRESSTKPDEDVERFVGATALNWVIAATDAHAKNYALLHSARSVRLAPFYDILSYLPYTEAPLHRVKLAMKLGGEYAVKRVTRKQWLRFAEESRVAERRVLAIVKDVLARLPDAIERTTNRAISDGLDEGVITDLRKRVLARTLRCRELMASVHE